MPFITEEIWAEVAPIAGKDGDTIMWQDYPGTDAHPSGAEFEEEIEWVKQFILGIRQIRGEMDISPGKPLPVILENSTEKDRQYAEQNSHLLARVGRVESVLSLAEDEEAPASATALLGNMRLLVPMAGTRQASPARQWRPRARTGQARQSRFCEQCPAGRGHKDQATACGARTADFAAGRAN
jgi:valyl-tRNA synthetase